MKKIPLTDRGKALGLGLLAAVLASACCLLPALLLLTGAGALAGLVSRLEGVFLAASAAILLGGGVLLLRKRSGEPCCPGSRPALSPPLLIVLLLATFGLSYAGFQGVVPALAAAAPEVPLTARAESRVLELQIQGMTCASCTAGIESALRAKPGVEAAKVDFGSASGRVVYDPARISARQIMEAVREAGYQALPSRSGKPSSAGGGCC